MGRHGVFAAILAASPLTALAAPFSATVILDGVPGAGIVAEGESVSGHLDFSSILSQQGLDIQLFSVDIVFNFADDQNDPAASETFEVVTNTGRYSLFPHPFRNGNALIRRRDIDHVTSGIEETETVTLDIPGLLTETVQSVVGAVPPVGEEVSRSPSILISDGVVNGFDAFTREQEFERTVFFRDGFERGLSFLLSGPQVQAALTPDGRLPFTMTATEGDFRFAGTTDPIVTYVATPMPQVPPAVIPLPASAPLLLAGLALLVAFRRRP